MTFDVTGIIQAAISLCVCLITGVLIPVIKSKYSAAQLNELVNWCKIGVMAAEQIYKATDGDAKKQYVIQYLKDNGIVADEDVINNAIEAAVLELHSNLYGAKKVAK